MGGETPQSERTPLLGGASVITVAPAARNSAGYGADGRASSGGHTLRESYDKMGLLSDAFDGKEQAYCFGQARAPPYKTAPCRGGSRAAPACRAAAVHR